MRRRNLVRCKVILRSHSRLGARRRLTTLVVCLLVSTLFGCDTFDFYGLLSETGAHGPGGGPVAISPLSVTVMVNAACTFTASGGTPPYRFSVVSGSGTIDAGTGVYTAPAVPSSDTIQVSDAAGGTAQARALSVQ